MRGLGLKRVALLSCAAAALLAACGGSQPPIGAPGAMPQRPAIAMRADSGRSWVLPEATSEDLLYVSNNCCWVSVYNYPQGKSVGRLKDFYLAAGQCVDNTAGTVYIADFGRSRVYQYLHGSARRRHTYYVPGANDCAIDPTTGNLAVASWGTTGVWIFANAKGTPTTYTDPDFVAYYGCGYDAKGDLFIQGVSHTGSGYVVLAELPKGGAQLRTLKVDQYLGWPCGVKWDGKDLAVGDQTTPVIYQFAINGSSLTEVGTTHLGSGAYSSANFWIQGQTLLTSTQCYHYCGRAKRGDAVMFFDYPAGGTAAKLVTRGLRAPTGASVSLAPSR